MEPPWQEKQLESDCPGVGDGGAPGEKMLGGELPFAAEGASSVLTGVIGPFESPGFFEVRCGLMDAGRGAARPQRNLKDIRCKGR